MLVPIRPSSIYDLEKKNHKHYSTTGKLHTSSSSSSSSSSSRVVVLSWVKAEPLYPHHNYIFG